MEAAEVDADIEADDDDIDADEDDDTGGRVGEGVVVAGEAARGGIMVAGGGRVEEVEEVAGGVGGADGEDAGRGVGVEVVVTGAGGADADRAHHVGLHGNGQERITAKVPNL